MKNKKSQTGITLIALVITIVIMLILAGIGITMISGDSGILTQSQSAVSKNLESEIKENIKLDINSKTMELQRNLTDDEIIEIIKSYDKDGCIKENTYIETEKGEKIDITDLSNIEMPILGVEVMPGLNQDEENLSKYYVYSGEGLSNLNQKMFNKTLGYNVCIEIMNDINFDGYSWQSIQSHTELGFSLKELNGNGHTISNLTVNGKSMFSMLAGYGEVVIKNIIFDEAKAIANNTNVAIIASQIYQNTVIENVSVKNSEISGSYQVATLVGTVFNENSSNGIKLSLKNCVVENCIIKSTQFDYMTSGLVGYVNKDDKEDIIFEGNNIIKNVKLYAVSNGYNTHANLYVAWSQGKENLINTAENVSVENVTFENI